MSVVLTWTKRSTDACAAASRMFRVPCTLIREISCAVPQSDTMAPQWTTKRQPSTARRSEGASVDGGRAVAGVCYIDNFVDAALLALRHDRAPGHAFNISDGVSVTWKEFTDGLAQGLGCPPVRFSAPYGVANAIGFSLESGYRLLRKVTRLQTSPLLSRQAVHVLGTNQDFSTARRRSSSAGRPARTTRPASRRRSP